MKIKSILLLSVLFFPAVTVSVYPQGNVSDTVRLQLFYTDSIGLSEVEVHAARVPAGNSRFDDLHPVELVTVGGANGDLYKALQTLPGAQVQGESGRLLVRGGSSEETQTFIDGMHVLNPYTSTGINSPARSRYSTFMFSGVNLASGGASLEYGQALSAVLPLETKDYSPINKLGVNASVVGMGGGGTRAFVHGSLSVDLNYQNLGLYNRLFPGRRNFEQPYHLYSAATQFRYTPDEHTVAKVYAQYDRTDFSVYEGDDRRLFRLDEDNVYLNATVRHTGKSGWHWFAGMAYAYYNRRVGSAVLTGDRYEERQQELHLKVKGYKRLAPTFRFDLGIESYLRLYENRYRLPAATDESAKVSPALAAAFLSASYYPLETLKTELSLRTEYNAYSHRMETAPRAAVYYYWGDFLLSGVVGRYTQLPEAEYLVCCRELASEACWQYNIGAQYNLHDRLFKAELYYKDYRHLAWYDGDVLTSNGYGYSKGIDFFFRDPVTVPRLEYQLSYTYNISRRKYSRYRTLTTPQYATRHNASLVVKYSIPRWRTIVGVTNSYSSGRPYHNPALPGEMNDEVKPYNSLDVGVTFIPHKKVIIHASATNILCRRNEFGRETNGKPILSIQDHFFYLGVFITLGKKAAYDASNF